MALPVRRRGADLEGPRWDPIAGLDHLTHQIADYLASWRDLPSRLAGGFVPPADVEETDDHYVVEIELAGVRKDDAEIQIAGRRLTVEGQRREKERVGVLRRRERVVGRFRYDVTLPGEVDDAGVEAHLDDGVLTVRVPKPASEQPRRIEVR